MGLQQYINLPRICVVGTQSAGKSSVLESIVGFDFLPRGEGVCTRRPLEMRLVHLHDKEATPFAYFGESNGHDRVKISDFCEVKREIEHLTNEIAGVNKGIIDSPIILTIHSPLCPDLTLIDLPGITRVPLRGSDQGEDIEQVTKSMSLRYASDPRTIILAVIPANVDITASDALSIARTADPQGLRTIGVITKIDLMDRGSDAIRILKGKDYNLHLGYVGVRNRSQSDIREGKCVKTALEEEQKWFSEHPTYRSLPPSMVGTASLIEKLTKVLFGHIKEFLPEIKREITELKRLAEARLGEVGDAIPPADSVERSQLVWSLVNDYCEVMSNTIRGKCDRRLPSSNTTNNAQSGGSRLREVFSELLTDAVLHPSTKYVSDNEIEHAVRVHEGDSLPGFPSPDTFEFLMRPHLAQIESPVTECLERAAMVLEHICNEVSENVLGRFPSLASKVSEIASGIIATEREKTAGILSDLTQAETSYLYTNDPSYLSQHASLVSVAAQDKMTNAQVEYERALAQYQREVDQIKSQHEIQKQQGTVSNLIGSITGPNLPPPPQPPSQISPQQAFLLEIRNRMNSYFSLVISHVRDTAPKVIGHFLIRKIQKELQFKLYATLTTANILDTLLGEPAHLAEERRMLQKQVEILGNASNVLNRDPQIAAATASSFTMHTQQQQQQVVNNYFRNNIPTNLLATTGTSSLTPPQTVNNKNPPFTATNFLNTSTPSPLVSSSLSNASAPGAHKSGFMTNPVAAVGGIASRMTQKATGAPANPLFG